MDQIDIVSTAFLQRLLLHSYCPSTSTICFNVNYRWPFDAITSSLIMSICNFFLFSLTARNAWVRGISAVLLVSCAWRRRWLNGSHIWRRRRQRCRLEKLKLSSAWLLWWWDCSDTTSSCQRSWQGLANLVTLAATQSELAHSDFGWWARPCVEKLRTYVRTYVVHSLVPRAALAKRPS